MENVIFENYRGMDINCYPSRTEENKDTNKIEHFWKIEAYHNGKLKGSWEYSAFRIDPQNQDQFNTYFQASIDDIRKNGRDLVDRIINERK